MDFGKISYNNLEESMFILPDVPQPFLPGIKNRNPLLYIGLSRWTYHEELKKKASPYPQPGTLPYYANHFNAVELNATHYEIPAAEKVSKWAKSIEDPSFRFCPKFFKGITHAGKLDKHKLGISMDFINRIKAFEDKLGIAFIQMNESYTVENKPALIEYLKGLPAGLDVSVELRNASWFNNTDLFHSFVKELNGLNKGLVITDSPGRRDAVHMHLSNSTAFIRFNAEGVNEIDMFRISQWKKQLQSWFLQGLEKSYFFLHIQDAADEDDFIEFAKAELKLT